MSSCQLLLESLLSPVVKQLLSRALCLLGVLEAQTVEVLSSDVGRPVDYGKKFTPMSHIRSRLCWSDSVS